MDEPVKPLVEEPIWLFPFDGMDVGDSFFVPTLSPAKMNYIIDTAAKKAKIRVRIYTASKDGYLGVRVWRIG